MAITLTEKAAKQINNALAKNGKGVALRLGIKKTGCAGFAYTFDYVDTIAQNDHVFESNNAKVVVDPQALPYLDGSQLDYVREGLNETFKFENPNIKDQCGCGESFTV